MLAEGIAIASPRTYRRIAKKHNLRKKERKALKKMRAKGIPTRLGHVATRPNSLWAWDISYFADGQGGFLYLFCVIDIYSRKIVGSKFYKNQRAHEAVDFFKEVLKANGITPGSGLRIHSDNGSAMVAHDTVELFESMGITLDTSRPLKSNDNAHIESLFKTLKHKYGLYVVDLDCIEKCNHLLQQVVDKYNNRPHPSVNRVPPSIRHAGVAEELKYLAKCQAAHEAYFQKNQKRFIQGKKRSFERAGDQYLNPTARQVLNGLSKFPNHKHLLTICKVMDQQGLFKLNAKVSNLESVEAPLPEL